MPSVRLGESLLSSPRQLAGDQGTINMPEQAIEMEELASPSTEDTPRGTLRKRTTSVFSLTSPRPESDLTPGEAFMLKFSRMSTHLANERTLLAWLRTSAAFFSIGLAFAKIDKFEDDLVAVAFVTVGIITFIVGCLRYYQVKTVLETKDSEFNTAQGFKRVGAGRMLSAAVLAFGVAATCLLYQSYQEISTKRDESAADKAAGEQLVALQQILAALNAQNAAACENTNGTDASD